MIDVVNLFVGSAVIAVLVTAGYIYVVRQNMRHRK